ncbi:MAG TPA: adenosylmethionine decarboxylase, partial [Polyangiaceae bacterium]|nr:adenosylmethionine decarboxylase [Polyangiaceae bacterium]
MQLTVALAVLEGIEASALDDEDRVRSCLEHAVVEGGFTLYDIRVVRFAPVGVTAAAIVGESHLTLHTWPEEGRAFVDIASCGEPGGVDRALAAIVRELPGARIAEESNV